MKHWVGALATGMFVACVGVASADEGGVQLGRVSDQMVEPNQFLADLVAGELSAEFWSPGRVAPRYYVLPELRSTATGAIQLSLLCFTYPEKTLLGEVSVKGSGGHPTQLVRMLVARAVEESRESVLSGQDEDARPRRAGRKPRSSERPANR